MGLAGALIRSGECGPSELPSTGPHGGAVLSRSCSISTDPSGLAGAGGLEGLWRPGVICAENVSGDTTATGTTCEPPAGGGDCWGLLNAGAVGRISGRPPPRGGRGCSRGWSLPKRTGQRSCVGYSGALVRCCGGGQSFPNRTGKGALNQRELDVPPKMTSMRMGWGAARGVGRRRSPGKAGAIRQWR